MNFPKIDACIVCEGVRREEFGKHVLLGFYGVTPHVHILIQNFQAPSCCVLYFAVARETLYNMQESMT